ncbi:hypothetical protein [Shimia sp. SDUM112013]|uniref:hypothetical protein n=1 Tax=Shimia sp. SDUM112013 TaxID=3136160 RepID=UPI0032EBA72B
MTFPNDLTRVSVSTTGSEGDWDSGLASLSTDGRYVTFESGATTLVADDTNNRSDVFVHDRQTGETRRVSLSSEGDESTETSGTPNISGNGRYVVFTSGATNFESDFPNRYTDVFLHDLQTGATELVAIPMPGAVFVNNYSTLPDVSDDGRYVTFFSLATSLVPGDTLRSTGDIFVFDRDTRTTSRLNENPEGETAQGFARDPVISGDGAFVAFDSAASDLVAGDTNGTNDIFVREQPSGAISRVSVASDGTEANDSSSQASLSGDGRFVAFSSRASNLVAGDNNGVTDVFLHDRVTGQTTRISDGLDGEEADEASGGSAISADGRYVVYGSNASNLVYGDTNRAGDIFVYDTLTGVTQRVSIAADGSEATHQSTGPDISADGGTISFTSHATNLVPGDTNLRDDVFVVSNPLLSNDGANLLRGGQGDERFIGMGGNDTIFGNGGDDVLDGGADNDSLLGGDGADTIVGGDGNDTIRGGESENDLRDVVYAGNGNDDIEGGYGNDELRGDDGHDTIEGGFGADTVIGGSGNDILTGSAWSDVILGGAGDDFVNGGWGHDRVNGGSGADRFFHIGIRDHGSDWIQDYDAAGGDVLVFGIGAATESQFQINTTHTSSPAGERSGDDNIEEAFVIYRPTGQIMWALVDGAGQDSINLMIAGQVFDLMA